MHFYLGHRDRGTHATLDACHIQGLQRLPRKLPSNPCKQHGGGWLLKMWKNLMHIIPVTWPLLVKWKVTCTEWGYSLLWSNSRTPLSTSHTKSTSLWKMSARLAKRFATGVHKARLYCLYSAALCITFLLPIWRHVLEWLPLVTGVHFNIYGWNNVDYESNSPFVNRGTFFI